MNFNKLIIFLAVVDSCFPILGYLGPLVNFVAIPFLIVFLSVLTKRKIEDKSLFQVIVLVLLISILTVISYFYAEYKERFISNYLLTIIGLITISIALSKNCNKNISPSLRFCIYLSCLFFIIQFLGFYVFNIEIDFNKILGGEGSRNHWNDWFRCSGFYDEPALFGMYMSALLVTDYIINKKIGTSGYLALICMILSMSFVSIFQSIVIGFIAIKNRKVKFTFIIICLLFLIFFFDSMVNRYYSFTSGNDGSNNTKIEILENFVRNIHLLLYGYGLVGYKIGYPEFYQGVYDLTFWLANLTLWGIGVGSVVSVLALYKIREYTKGEIILIFMVLIKMTTPTLLIYWLFLIFFFVYKPPNRDLGGITPQQKLEQLT